MLFGQLTQNRAFSAACLAPEGRFSRFYENLLDSPGTAHPLRPRKKHNRPLSPFRAKAISC